MNSWRTKLAVILAVGFCSISVPSFSLAQTPTSTPPAARTTAEKAADAKIESAARHLRVVEEDGGKTLKLQLSSRKFVRADGKGPAVYLTGAVHVADEAFYQTLQEFLDSKDVVLFEGVKPPGAGAMEHAKLEESDEQRVTATKRRIQLLALFVEQFRAATNEYPAKLADLPEGIDPKMGKMLDNMEVDAWGKPLVYRIDTIVKTVDTVQVAKTTYDIVSYGADGEEGGEGVAADIQYSMQTPVKVGSLKQEEGIQSQLADALGLVFQLDAMDHSKPNWRNSDLSIDQIQDRMETGGADADQLFSMISGDSFMAKVMGFALKFVGAVPSLSNMFKMMLVDMLAQADELMASMPGEMGAMMEVIINDRNQVVMDDLAAIVEKEPGVESVGIIYGAGHLPDMEERMAEQLGYKYESDEWFTAISVDVTKTGMSVKQATQMRNNMKKMIAQQLKAAKKAK